MSKLSMGRVILGGLLAGVVTNVIDFVVNVPLLGAKWDAATRLLNVDIPKWSTITMVGWIASDLAMGLLAVWLYAAIRPRFGAGPGTAMRAGFMVWLIGHVAYLSFYFMGLFPLDLVLLSGAGAVVALVLGTLAGAAVYQEA